MPNDGSCFKPGNPSNALPPQCPKSAGRAPYAPTKDGVSRRLLMN
ncbi:hypothetical protein FDUTEX481_00208 [Tolypothrix sp. PCC 7601]|nr:hypothetical protein FDUTEX481_00208 [Tolypothrix sp. PCC 7601]